MFIFDCLFQIRWFAAETRNYDEQDKLTYCLYFKLLCTLPLSVSYMKYNYFATCGYCERE